MNLPDFRSAGVGEKLLATLVLALALLLLRALVGAFTRTTSAARTSDHTERVRFWGAQAVSLATLALLVVGGARIWVGDPARLATIAGLVTAGVAVALQRVITSFAAYFIILRGRVYTVGDRITMSGVRGDVVALGFMQTTVMEMGEPPSAQGAPPAVWVTSRQYTGRVVRVTNDKIFDTPVYNYTREFPFLWEELHLPIKYGSDRARAEAILLDVAHRQTSHLADEAKAALAALRRVYYLPEDATGLDPVVYYRLTDNWVELTLRFVAGTHGVRPLKDRMSRDVLAALEEAKIEIASGTYEIVGLPPIRVQLARDDDPPR